jgi:hypothetical protein
VWLQHRMLRKQTSQHWRMEIDCSPWPDLNDISNE